MNNNNMMMTAIELAKRELIDQIGVRQDALLALTRVTEREGTEPAGPLAVGPFGGKAERVPVAIVPVVKGKVGVGAAAKTPPSPPRPQPAAKRQAPSVSLNGSKLAERALLVRSLPEPFGADEVRAKCGLDWKNASNWITQAGLKGWVQRVELGRYRRTKKFPGLAAEGVSQTKAVPVNPPREQVAVAALEPAAKAEAAEAKAELIKKLEEACRKRDQANANAQDKLAAIYQQKIDELERLVGI